MKKRYRFGYFFVKVAKGLALLLIFAGIGFCIVQYTQAETEASAAAYQPSASLQRTLEKLKQAVAATGRIVNSFNADDKLPIRHVAEPRFPALINSNPDFTQVSHVLVMVDQERELLKQSLVGRFDKSVKAIQEKLRAYTEELESLPQPSPAARPTPVPTVKPSRAPTQAQDSLFSSSLSADEVNKRSASLGRVKDFLKALETKAENPDNRARLSQAEDQLELLDKLLPAKPSAQSNSNSTPSDQGSAGQVRRVFLAERVEGRLGELRDEVSQVMLTAWTLDDALEQATDLNSAEREKCRVATLAQKGIWLSGVSKILTGLLAAVVGSFLILVCADLIATFLDTAEHTGVVSELVNAVRGSVVIRRTRDGPPQI